MAKSKKERVGLWLIGARGGVASTALLGLCALQSGKTGTVGLVTENEDFRSASLPAWTEFVPGGFEIRDVPILETVTTLGGNHRAISAELIDSCRKQIKSVEERIVPGTLRGCGSTISSLATLPVPVENSAEETVVRLQSQLDSFVKANDLSDLIVINVSSTEPSSPTVGEIVDLITSNEDEAAGRQAAQKAWDKALKRKCTDGSKSGLPASSLYAYAVLKRGWTFINFTPSPASPLPLALMWAQQFGGSFMGFDGKTGETLMKSVLAPMFRDRNLEVMSWVGHNIFGNLDGVVLDDPANKATKVASKDRLLGQILGYRPQTLVSIEYIESLGDWKTAWDHIHFRGFLGTPMSLQFTWQGCDSILAAPLVLDLARLALTAKRRGQTGHLDFLASFFKSPQGAKTHEFARQYCSLYDWIWDGKNEK